MLRHGGLFPGPGVDATRRRLVADAREAIGQGCDHIADQDVADRVGRVQEADAPARAGQADRSPPSCRAWCRAIRRARRSRNAWVAKGSNPSATGLAAGKLSLQIRGLSCWREYAIGAHV